MKPEQTRNNLNNKESLNKKRKSVLHGMIKMLGKAKGFISRQKHNYRVAIIRSSAGNFLNNLTAQYDSIYTVALGANSIELGTINSIGNAIAALISVPAGWLMDRYGIKKIYLLGIGLMAGSALVYALAPDWRYLIVAIIFLTISMRLLSTGCSIICSNSVNNKDRSTAQNLCVTLGSISAMIAPLIAAPLITAFGGLTAEGIKPLYFIRSIGYGFILIFLIFQLREIVHTPQKREGEETSPSFIDGFREIFTGSVVLRRWIIVSALTWLPMAMTSPFIPLFARQIKGANAYLLGGMATAALLAQLLFGLPMGRLADKIGRKKVIYLLAPLWYASYLLLIVSGSPVTLILAGALQTFYFLTSGITMTMTLELVPVEQIGRWTGILGLLRGLVTIPAPILAGLIWNSLGPIYVFIIPLAIDLLLRIPLFTTIPETLELKLS